MALQPLGDLVSRDASFLSPVFNYMQLEDRLLNAPALRGIALRYDYFCVPGSPGDYGSRGR
jgi:hypothetical protein